MIPGVKSVAVLVSKCSVLDTLHILKPWAHSVISAIKDSHIHAC